MGFQLDTQHNMILTKRWIMVVPRSKGWIGEVPTNAAGMVGMVFCKSEKEYQGWMDLGPMEALKEFGVPRKHVES